MMESCTTETEVLHEAVGLFCNQTHDTIMCWPVTRAGQTAVARCPYQTFSRLPNNVTKYCMENGTWAVGDYLACYSNATIHNSSPVSTDFPGIALMYDIGYSITTVVLIIALTIFIYFRSLYCLRNSIHCHLFAAFLLNNIMWFIVHHNLSALSESNFEWVCKSVLVLYSYLSTVPFFWMFIEGLYLFTIIVWAFSAQKIRLWYYIIIGWVLPLGITLIWMTVKIHVTPVSQTCWIPEDTGTFEKIDFILHGSVITILLCNLIFMVSIIWVLVAKLRTSTSLETRQGKKAVKATLVLLPLLGITFMLLLCDSSKHPNIKKTFAYINVIFQSLQGSFVALFYCFLNSEVQSTIRKKWDSVMSSRRRSSSSSKSTCLASGPHKFVLYTTTHVNGSDVKNSNGSFARKCKDLELKQVIVKSKEAETEICASVGDLHDLNV